MEYHEISRKLYTALKIAESELDSMRQKATEPIAVTGMACRFPGADNIEEFWQQLSRGYDTVKKVPADRWDADYFYDSNPDAAGKSYCSYGSFLDDVKGFDAGFFGITPSEAKQMDPQQRILLETTWHALESANIKPTTLAGSSASVFLGVSDSNYSQLASGELGETLNGHFITGNAISTASGRISYYLGLQGANMVVNTACSSSLTAIDLGIQSLRSGKTNLILAGGVNLILIPHGHISLSATRALSVDGRCKTFDDSADGYGRGEGCGIVVLKRYSDAIKDGDRIFAVIKGSAINQDGASNGMTAPSGKAQVRLMNEAVAAAGIEPDKVDFIEAHGTGTKLGDPIEVEALQHVYSRSRTSANPLYVGAVKSNLGHLESAAGIASFIKTSLALYNRQLPGNIHYTKSNPAIAWDNNVHVPIALTELKYEESVAAISSFGFSGTNVHMILQSVEKENKEITEDNAAILLLSAKSDESLSQLITNYIQYLSSTDNSWQDICYTAATCREQFDKRIAITANNKAEAIRLLNQTDTQVVVGSETIAEEYIKLADRYVGGNQITQNELPFTGKKVTIPNYAFHHVAYWVDSDIYRFLCNPQEVNTNRVKEDITVNVDESNYSDYLLQIFKEITELPEKQISVDADLFSMGADSIMIMQLKERIYADTKVGLEVAAFYNQLNTISKIEQYLVEHVKDKLYQKPARNNKPILSERTSNKNGAFVPYKEIQTENHSRSEVEKESLNKLVKELVEKSSSSKEHTQKYRQWLANNRNIAGYKPLWKEMVYQPVAEKASGVYIWDKAGNRFLDFTMGFGVHLFGYNPPFINEHLQEALKDQMYLGALSPLAGELAEKICNVTDNERAAFYNTGTEAVMVALRLARAITSKNKVVIFSGSYHGTYDGILAREGQEIHAEPLAPGVSDSIKEDVLVLEYGNKEQLAIISEMAGEIAAVLVEPVQSRRPDLFPEDYLKELRSLTEACNIALIFDEVISGFRFALNGIRAYTDVRSDISIYGKVIGGGVPIGIVAGSAKYLDAVDGGFWSYGDDSYPASRTTFVAGTFCHHPLAMRAGISVIQHLEDNPNIYDELNSRTSALCNELDEFFKTEHIPVKMVHFGSLFRFVLKGNAELLFYKLITKGIYIWEGRNCYVSTAHTPEDIQTLVEAVKQSCIELRAEGWLERAEGKSSRKMRLSYPQQNIWWAVQLNPDNGDFNLAETLLIDNDFDINTFEKACQLVIDKYEILRTSFSEEEGIPYQDVADEVIFSLDRKDIDSEIDVRHYCAEYSSQAFSLDVAPLLRVAGGRLNDSRSYLCIVVHHIVCDGWALDLLFDELTSTYTQLLDGSYTKQGTAMQYSEFLNHEEQLLKDKSLKAFWEGQVKEVKPIRIVAQEGLKSDSLQGSVDIIVAGEAFSKIKSLAKTRGTTSFVITVAVTKMLLYKYTQAENIVVGSPAPARSKPGLNKLMGHTLNLIVLNSKVKKEDSFETFIKQLHNTITSAYEKQDYPFELLKNEFHVNRENKVNPFFDIEISMQNFRARRVNAKKQTGGLKLKNISDLSLDNRKYPMEFRFDEGHEDIELKLVYDPSLYSMVFINELLTEWSQLLKAALEHPEASISILVDMITQISNENEQNAITNVRKSGLSKLMAARQNKN